MPSLKQLARAYVKPIGCAYLFFTVTLFVFACIIAEDLDVNGKVCLWFGTFGPLLGIQDLLNVFFIGESAKVNNEMKVAITTVFIIRMITSILLIPATTISYIQSNQGDSEHNHSDPYDEEDISIGTVLIAFYYFSTLWLFGLLVVYAFLVAKYVKSVETAHNVDIVDETGLGISIAFVICGGFSGIYVAIAHSKLAPYVQATSSRYYGMYLALTIFVAWIVVWLIIAIYTCWLRWPKPQRIQDNQGNVYKILTKILLSFIKTANIFSITINYRNSSSSR